MLKLQSEISKKGLIQMRGKSLWSGKSIENPVKGR